MRKLPTDTDALSKQPPKVSMWRMLRFGLDVFLKTIPWALFAYVLLSIFRGLSWGFTTLFTQELFDAVANAITHNQPIQRVFLMIAALGATFVIKEACDGINVYMHNVLFGKPEYAIRSMIHSKLARIDPICMEDTKTHDDINKAMESVWTIPFMFAFGSYTLTLYPAYFIFMGCYLHHLKPQFVVAMVLVFIPSLASQLIRTRIMSKLEDKAAPIRREYDYYRKTIVDKEYYKETRMLGAYRFFFTRMIQKLKQLGKTELQANRRTNALELGMSLLSSAGYAGILFMLITALLQGEISVGTFAAVFGSIAMLFESMNGLIGFVLGNVAANMGRAQNILRLLDMPERGGTEVMSAGEQGITARHVSFTYPSTESAGVCDVSLTIQTGETVAIVGENGAGKTTLVRLLLGLYLPTQGTVTRSGMDTAQGNMQSLFGNVSGVFQRYQRYQMTLEDNVRISDVCSPAAMDTAVRLANVDTGSPSFPQGADTMLSRAFDGVELSGGEWQRVAIARGLYRAHDMVVLDEPTAAIDPIEESRIYHQFADISRGKTTIIVTHRLGSTRMANRVIVMDKGRIAEVGSHDELMARNGLYAEMFHAQAAWYA